MPRYTPLQRRRLVRQFQSSGLTLATFCRQHSLSVSSLCAWRRQIQLPELPSDPVPNQWRPVELLAQPSPTAAGPRDYVIELGPCRLHIPSGFRRDEVATLLLLLQNDQGGAPC